MRASRDPVRTVMTQLEASFDASVSAEEDAAASDLAAALERGLALAERLRANRGAMRVLLADGATAPVSRIGTEHLVCGDPPALILPAATAALLASDAGTPPSASAETLMQALRPWADRRNRVEVSWCAGTAFQLGRLVAAAPDHVVLEREAGRVMIPLGLIGAIRLVPGG